MPEPKVTTEAIEAAAKYIKEATGETPGHEYVRSVLVAAAPHLYDQAPEDAAASLETYLLFVFRQQAQNA